MSTNWEKQLMKTDIQKLVCFAIDDREFTVKDKGFLSVSVVCLVLRFVIRVTCPNKVNKQPVILLVRVSFVLSSTQRVISIRRLSIADLWRALSCTFNTVACHELDGAKEKARRVATNHELFTC
jgi:hypothetical protein